MILQTAFTLPVPMDEAFDVLVDPAAVAAALPGARPSGPRATDGELDLEVEGGEPVTLHGHVHPGERDRQAGALSFHAAGSEPGGGTITAGGAVRLRDAGGITAVAIQLEVDAGGRLTAGGAPALEAAVRRLVDGLAEGLRERVAAEPVAVSADVDTRAEMQRFEPQPEAAVEEAIGYAWMEAVESRELDAEGHAAEPDAVVAAPATPPPPAPAQTAWLRPEHTVPGRVSVVTEGPLPIAGIPVGDGPGARVRALHRARPWVMPALLVGLLAIVLLLRRRRQD